MPEVALSTIIPQFTIVLIEFAVFAKKLFVLSRTITPFLIVVKPVMLTVEFVGI